MSERSEDRYFGNAFVLWFNGGLFDGGEALAFTRDELQVLHAVALLDWSQVEPSILGTLFERALNPDMRGSWVRTTQTRRRSCGWWSRWC